MIGGGRSGGQEEHHFGGCGLVPELIVFGSRVGMCLTGDSRHGPFGADDLFGRVGV
jgi:hypothetical protein